MRVTVVVPVHDVGPHFRPCLESLRAQTLPREDFEVVFVDDGSGDGSGRRMTEEVALSRNLRVVQLPHTGGPGAARNTGLDQARGEFVLFVDDRDRLAPEALEALYAKASATGADIVVPRTAGHGRTVPQDAWAVPLDHGHLLTHPQLAAALTPRMLFRRSFLQEQQLRFAEGPVPLGGEAFALRAHLTARSVAVVHDRVCYHRAQPVRGLPAAADGSGAPDAGHARALSASGLFDLLDWALEAGPVKDQVAAVCYRSALLDALPEHVKRTPGPALADLVGRWSEVANRRVAPSADAYLPMFARVRSAVLRTGRPEAVAALLEAEAGITHQPCLDGAEWRGGRFTVEVSTHLVRHVKGRAPEPVRFVQDGDHLRWDLPAGLAALPGVAQAAAATGELPAARLRAVARHRELGEELVLPGEHLLTAVQLGRNAQGLATFALRIDATSHFDPVPQHGAVPAGLWDFSAELAVCGHTVVRRLGNQRGVLVDARMRVAFVPGPTFVDPYWTNNDFLTVWVSPTTYAPLRKGLREAERSLVRADGQQVSVQIPLELGGLPEPVPVVVSLTAPDAPAAHCRGVIDAPAAPDLAVLRFTVPVAELPVAAEAAWRLGVGRDTTAADLRLNLRYHAPDGRWAVERVPQ
ncbi:glycosyltransferase family 2 protein [Yinghuangia soli]|uniref:Glycosyltransferase n=1 Tax=Yinghuangia soli TaxID=2908204 RepID=A0AA41TZ94_9ACTN|nr:glycosyltransferase family 2 protein [Yinghuangia soli]MCF2527266.1 glycosyltransferase [Yinghuangia soli]